MATCAAAGDVTPVATVSAHAVAAFSLLPADVNVSEAVAVPELALATVKVLVPPAAVRQPPVTEARVPKVKLGSVSTTLLPAASSKVAAVVNE